MDTVGIVAFCHGFKLDNDWFDYREIGLCTIDGTNHCLLEYSCVLGINFYSEEIKKSIEEQTSSVHGLAYATEEKFLREPHFIKDDVLHWYHTFSSKQRPTVGLYGVNPLTKLFRALNIPTVNLQDFGLNDLMCLPIGTIKVMSPGDYSANWCRQHQHGKLGVWHDCCTRVMVCKMSWWLRKELKVQPTVAEVNAQRVLWQKRCDELLDWILCEYCIKEKDEAFQEGLGLDWIPDNCDGKCKIVQYIFERDVTDNTWRDNVSYKDEFSECMRKWPESIKE